MAKRMENTTNPHTGDRMVSKQSSDAYDEGWERVFGKKEQAEDKPKADDDKHSRS